ncbi:MAG: hypothetical protein IRZ29_00465 [Thermoflavifilum sp.]|nr:hypothetical protein [Thermoflavifilum sp.]
MSFKYNAQTLTAIEKLLQEAGYIIRYEKGNFQSGYCVIEEKKVVVMNKFLNTESRINVLIDIIQGLSIVETDLSPASRKYYQLIQATVSTPSDHSSQTPVQS